MLSYSRGRAALVAGVVAALVCAAAPAASFAAPSVRNPYGVQVVRFAPGTTPAAMRQAVADAGGTVITDLSAINAMAVASKASGFKGAMRSEPRVRGVWLDRVTARPSAFTPDPFHDADAFNGENAPGFLQWEDDRDGVRQAWATTTGSPAVKVAVLDTGIERNHPEIKSNLLRAVSTVPCNELRQFVTPPARLDCSPNDLEGHGTWVASRIAGDDNGFASNGIAPDARILSYKVLAAGLGGLTTWIVDAMIRACDADADVINMSLGGYDDPNDPDFPAENVDDYFLWQDAVNYCRGKGTAIVASAGNEHVRNLRQTVTLTGSTGTRTIAGAGVVDPAAGINTLPGDTELVRFGNDFRGMLETPAGVPGVVMVSSTGNTIANPGAPGANVVAAHTPPATAVGTQDNLAYYSSYGPRVDLAAPGGARKFGVPKFDTRPGTDLLFGGWGQLGAIAPNGEICATAGGPEDFACFLLNREGFAWLQGTSMSSPQVAGVAALVLSAHPELRNRPDALLARLQATVKTTMTNHTGPTDPRPDTAAAQGAFNGTLCAVPTSTDPAGPKVGYCHIDWTNAIPFSEAYGAGMVDAAPAVAP